MTFDEARPVVETRLRAYSFAPRAGAPLRGAAAHVEDALRLLRTSERQLIAWRYRDGLDWDRIARRTGASRSSLLARADRTLFALAALLGVLRLDEPSETAGAGRGA